MTDCSRRGMLQSILTAFVALLTIVCLQLPMGEFPLWNGENPGHRNQYELMAEAILDGRITFDYGDENSLSTLENPYDPEERKAAGVYYHWDHAYYEGEYYMYFGIVPVFLIFLPYRVLTGESLPTFRGTANFAAAAIIGIFVLFDLLRRRFFPSLPFGIYLCLSVTFSAMSIWYASVEPALYCTAITAAIMLIIWSLYFFIRAVWVETRENLQIALASVGALLGALAFGCRPPIALANLLVIPALVVFLRERKFTLRLFGKLCLAALPYLVVGAALMLYNYVRFDDPFEFGQAYQLTVADQSNYSVTLDGEMLLRILRGIGEQFFDVNGTTATFPYLRTGGVLIHFPILYLSLGLADPRAFRTMKQHKLSLLMLGLLVTVLVITALDVMWSPYLLERYRMDIYFLMGIGAYLAVGIWYESVGRWLRGVIASVSVLLSGSAVLTCFLLALYRVNVSSPHRVAEVAVFLGLGG